MPTSNGTTNKSKTNGGSGESGGRKIPEFVRYHLNDEEMSQAKNAAETYADVGQIVEQFVDEGYKFSASHDSYGGGSQCFITPSSQDNPNSGWTLTARAPTMVAAVAVLCWKHYTLFSQIWPKESGQPRGENWG